MDKEKRPYGTKPYDHLEDITTNACSTTECTGLIAHAPLSQDEYEAYMEIYDFGPPITPDNRAEEGAGPAFGSDHTSDHIPR